jgi:ribonuclease HI
MTSVTLIADASFDPRTKAAGWAGWAKTAGRDSIIYAGAFKIAPICSAEAELFAIVNVMHIAVAEGLIEHGSEVLVQSDCADALAVIRKIVPSAIDRKHRDGVPVPVRRRKLPSPQSDRAAATIARLVDEMGLSLAVRHVRGHKEGPGRQWVNRQCDMAARRAMRAQKREKAA